MQLREVEVAIVGRATLDEANQHVGVAIGTRLAPSDGSEAGQELCAERSHGEDFRPQAANRFIECRHGCCTRFRGTTPR